MISLENKSGHFMLAQPEEEEDEDANSESEVAEERCEVANKFQAKELKKIRGRLVFLEKLLSDNIDNLTN